MKINLTEEQKEYIKVQITSGNFKNANEAINDALKNHQYYRHKILEYLKTEIDKGWSGKTSKRTIPEIIAAKKKGF